MTYSSQGELITFRYRGLHTGPSASDKNMDTPNGVSIFLAGAERCQAYTQLFGSQSKNRSLIDEQILLAFISPHRVIIQYRVIFFNAEF